MHADYRVSDGKISVERQRPFALGDCPLDSVGEAKDSAHRHVSEGVVGRELQRSGRGRFGRREARGPFSGRNSRIQ
jgi:hypothetical protein